MSAPKRAGTDSKRDRKISKRQAAQALARLQRYVATTFLLSAAFGSYLLATDQSIWRLAVSHAIGLIVIVAVDVILAVLNVAGVKQVYLPSLLWAALTLLLQLGDVVTAPQYKMTIAYFASYLFRLWAFDALLVMQVLGIAVGLIGRTYVSALTRKQETFFNMTARSSRRDFLQIMAFIGSFIVLAGVLGAAEALSPNTSQSSPSQSTQALNGLPAGAIANVNQLETNAPTYFEFPVGYPNILFKNSNGSLTALSLLCTHICCECQYVSSSNQIQCPCHGSIFAHDGSVLLGPAAVPLPSIELMTDTSGNVFPKAIKGSSPCVQA